MPDKPLIIKNGVLVQLTLKATPINISYK